MEDIFDIINSKFIKLMELIEKNNDEFINRLSNLEIKLDNIHNKLLIVNKIANNKKKNKSKKYEKNEKDKNNEKSNDRDKNNKINKNKIFKSASLIFVNDFNEHLMCEEYRYKEKKILTHPIGGKVETYDDDILETAIREFIEETNLEKYDYKYVDKKDKNALIKSIKKLIEKKNKYFDFIVNKELRYFHRYYIVKLNKIANNNSQDNKKKEFIESINNITTFFNDNYKTEINSLKWLNLSNNDIINNEKKHFSHLTKMFFNISLKNNYF